MSRHGVSSMIAKSFAVTKMRFKRLIVCPRKDITAGLAIQEILFSDLKRLNEVEENLRNLHIPLKPPNGVEESSIEFTRRRAAEIQKEAYEAEIARLNEKIYGIRYSGESRAEDKECSIEDSSMKPTKPFITMKPWKRSCDLDDLSLSSSSLSASNGSNHPLTCTESSWTSVRSKMDSKEDLKTEMWLEKNETLKSKLRNILTNEGASKEIMELKGSVDRCCAYLYELEEENKKLREENIKLSFENAEIGKLQKSLEKVRKERDAYATVLKCETRTEDEETKDESKHKANNIEKAEPQKEWMANICHDTDSVLQRKQEMGAGDMG